MRLPIPSPAWMRRHDLLGRRATGIVLAIIVHILGFLLLMSLTPATLRKLTPELKSFPLLSFSENPAPKPAASARAQRRETEKTPPPPPLPPPPPTPLKMMIVSSEVFRASDISKIHPQRADSAPGAADVGSGEGEGPGEGPGGEKLYPADWYVEPTTAEMAFYIKEQRQAGWGMIACRTVPNYRVEDCQELGESPRGSGLARALRQAAWQFKIRPPRIGGKPQMGVWVRILFDFQVGVVK
ncbi:hypothetical protein Swit_3840 [Rhizorhabdus wittichii RW1]|uniref:TonB family protein n=1 Tax=Rhizorhabdus wittichii (strain DSM 6014 / CCUG 31198 / JCM 15750 / NBRC 105917 / EY 4224 / RW1) TaxID=392499 RepID=A0A9J9HEC5_RHIWR|nr:hypothetical protein Swit_3840 [Rhizorhabdus wittichii RW1]